MKIETIVNLKLGEPDAHVMMRHAKTVVRLLLIVALIATTLLLIYFRPAAYLAAFAVPVLVLTLIYVSYLERRSRASQLRTDDQLSISQEEIEMNVQYAGIYTGMILLLLFSLSALIVASTMVEDWSMIGLVSAVLFLLMALIVFPYIPLFIADSGTNERSKLKREASLRDDPLE